MVIEKPRCNKCNSSQIYTRQVRKPTKERVCNQCGNVEEIQSEGGNK